MTNLTDKKPVACSGWVMRRTDSHIQSNSEVSVTRSGDVQQPAYMVNTVLTTVPDSDKRWGNTPCSLEEPTEEVQVYSSEYTEEYN